MVNPQADAGRVGVSATTTATEFVSTEAGDQHQPPSENDWTSTALAALVMNLNGLLPREHRLPYTPEQAAQT